VVVSHTHKPSVFYFVRGFGRYLEVGGEGRVRGSRSAAYGKILMNDSEAAQVAALEPDEQRARLDRLDAAQHGRMLDDWEFWARPNQLPPPGDWRVWLLLAGRGFGKTRSGAEFVRARVESGLASRVALVGPTAGLRTYEKIRGVAGDH